MKHDATVGRLRPTRTFSVAASRPIRHLSVPPHDSGMTMRANRADRSEDAATQTESLNRLRSSPSGVRSQSMAEPHRTATQSNGAATLGETGTS